MKILEKPDVDSWSHNCRCSNCETKLEIDATDIRHIHSPSDGRYPSSDTYNVQCPVCSHHINIPPALIPKIIQIEAQKRSSPRSSSYFDR